ncbi:hypothetical protein DSO57_1002433 [Entomophthora muscae]|uniref:Uncharacterized protein n=1 Tax=Entomophthora muscae TaxID=34485 RepID=A0ACC2SAL0_9FUNG|nr:hypothetical protein DSO57_1002433 [Entomophthora muscae]
MVSIVRSKQDGKIYAMKTLNKLYILRCQELSFYMEEKDVLTLSRFSPWIPKLHATFQDSENLYLVMEYAGGGDLYNLLVRNSLPIISEDDARFYLAETVLALSDLHALNYVHRDLKPQNILLDNDGHIKLADFGSCIQLNPDGKITSNIPVGTSDYISPEVLQAQERNASYGPECDWWSLGILLYELLQGDPPFSSDNLLETHSQIMNHQKHLAFYGMYPISDEAKDLIQKLICDRDVRLGKNGPQEIKEHPFFAGIDWENIRHTTPPFVPSLISPDDTSNFSGYEGDEDNHEISVVPKTTKEFLGTSLPFIGFTHHTRPTPKHGNDVSDIALADSFMQNFKARDSPEPVNQEEAFEIQTRNGSQDYSEATFFSKPSSPRGFSSEKDGLLEELRKAQDIIRNQKEQIHLLNSKLVHLEEKDATQEEEKLELTRILEILEKKIDEDEAYRQRLQTANTMLSEERDKAQSEAKQFKRALVEFSKLHQDMKKATITLEQSREQADSNFEIMKAKCDSLKYDNQNMKSKLERLEARCLAAPKQEEISKVLKDLSDSQAQATRLASDLQAMTEANQSLISQIERQASENPSASSPSVAIDLKIYNDIVANIELEAKNHHLLTTIYQDLQAQKERMPSMQDVKESRDDALQRADQMLRLNEKQAVLIKSLMDKITYLEASHIGQQGDSTPDAEARLAALIVENQSLKCSLAFKDQKLQEIVTKMVLAEATKPTFWPKSKERAKEKQRVLMHSLQSLEQRLRLVERENSQLRFMNQLSQSDPADEPSGSSSRFSFFNESARFDSSLAEPTQGRPKSTPSTSKDTFNYTQAILPGSSPPTARPNQFQERNLNSKFGISHIK